MFDHFSEKAMMAFAEYFFCFNHWWMGMSSSSFCLFVFLVPITAFSVGQGGGKGFHVRIVSLLSVWGCVFDISFRDKEVSLVLRYVFTLTDSISLKRRRRRRRQLVGREEEKLSKAKNKFIILTMSNFILIWRSPFDFPTFPFSIEFWFCSKWYQFVCFRNK